MLKQNLDKISYILFLILPLTIIAGPSVVSKYFFNHLLYLYNFLVISIINFIYDNTLNY